MRYRPSSYMLRRRQSLGGRLLRALAWLVAGVLALVGIVLLLSAPLAELVAGRMLAARGLGPATLDITRLDPGGISVRGLTVLGGAAKVAEIDVTYDWRELMQGHVDAVRIDGLDAKVMWAADGKISVGGLQIYPRVPEVAAPTTPPAPAQPAAKPPPANNAPALRSLIVGNSKLVLALPSGDINLPLAITATQGDTGRALEFSLTGSGKGVEFNTSVNAIEPLGKAAQGAAALSFKISALTLPGMAENISGESTLNVSFDAKGAKADNSRAELAFSLPKAARSNPLGLDDSKPIKVALAGINSQLLSFTLDRTTPISRAKMDAAVTLASGGTELRAMLKGWADVPLANSAGVVSDPQDFNIERLGVTARQVPLEGGLVDASMMILDFKGPVAVADGRVTANIKATALANLAERIETNLVAGFRLDGLSQSFDVKELWLEAENLNLGPSLAQGINRANLDANAKSAQQVNLVFGSSGGVTLTTDLALSGDLPKIITDATTQPPTMASLALPKLALAGYLTQAGDALKGSIKLAVADGKLTHPFVGLSDLAATLSFDGKVLSGPLSARLMEAADPARPKALDRRGATLMSNITVDSDSIDIKGNLTAGAEVEIGTFRYDQKGAAPGTLAIKIPPRTWMSEPSFLDAFGPIAALTNTTGTLGLELRATPTKTGTIDGKLSLALADFGFNAGALTMQGVNAAIELEQVWPPRAKSPQRLSFAKLLAGVPFTDGDFTVSLPGDATAIITLADIKLAGGTVTGRDLIVPLDNRDQAFAMDVNNVDLGALVAAFPTDGLSAIGKLAGRLPLRLTNSRLFIEKGRLSGRNGNIRYAPATAPAALAQGGGTILLQALADFKFDEVTANLNGDVTKDLAISLSLKGRNPGLYGGYPIEFNLNLDGPLNRLVRDGLSGYRIPDDIKQRLEQQGLGPAGN